MKVFNCKTKDIEEVPEKVAVVEGYLHSGQYHKHRDGITLGEDEGITWWSLSPKSGRFEYRYENGELKIMKGFTIPIKEDLGDRYRFGYEGYYFESIKDLLTWIYLYNEHDFSEKDMAYAFGKRKYNDELIKL